MWSLGVIAFALLSCGTPCYATRKLNVVDQNVKRSFSCPDYALVSRALSSLNFCAYVNSRVCSLLALFPPTSLPLASLLSTHTQMQPTPSSSRTASLSLPSPPT